MKKIKLSLLIILLLNLLFTASIKAQNTKPLFPWQDDLWGLRYSEELELMTPFLAGAYDFKIDKFYYQIGTRLDLTRDTALAIDYGRWIQTKLPAYRYQKGSTTSFIYDDLVNQFEDLNLALFKGQIDGDDSLEVKYLSLDYKEELETNYQIRANFNLSAVYGQDQKGEFSLIKTKLPINKDNFYLTGYAGYINHGPILKPSFNLKDYVKGYQKSGDSLIALNLEQRFLLSDDYLMLEGAIFSQLGAVVNYQDGISRDDLKANLGLALIAPLDDRFQLRLSSYITKEKNWEPYSISINLQPFKF